MALTDVFLTLGRDSFLQLIRGISIGKLKTYQIYDRVKTRTHLAKLNAENLQKAAGRLWDRLGERDDEFAQDLSQAILVSHLPLIIEVLNFLGIPHEDGFFAKDVDARPFLTEGWQERVHEKFQGACPDAVLRFYTGHLEWEVHARK
ncbi:MAG: hypothetical protein ACRD96_29485 [Bryobacteraceae bacterium]